MNIIPNFLESDRLADLRSRYTDSLGKAVFEINEMARWPNDLYAGNFGPVYVLRLEDYMDYFTEKFRHIPQFSGYRLNVCYMHIWNKGSGIRWHRDSVGINERIGVTIYLNEHWDSNWGGLFLYEKNGNYSWYCPQENHCVWFESPMWHSVSIISSDIPHPRLSVQLFFDR